MKRAYTAAKDDVRCYQDITLRDGSGARCMRPGPMNGLCPQHFRLASQGVKARMMNGAHFLDAIYAEGVARQRK